MKKPKTTSQFISSSLLKKVIIFTGMVLVILTAYWILRPLTLRMIYSAGIPDLPDLSGYSPAVSEYIEQTYTETMDKPYLDDMAGKLAMVYHANFFYQDAESCYAVARNLNPDEWLWHYYTALIKEELGDPKATIKNLKNVVKIYPRVPHAWFRLGNSYLKQNSFESAESAFKKVLNSGKFEFGKKTPDRGAFPLAAYARLNLGRIYFNQEKYDQANTELMQLVQEYPRFGAAYRLLGQLFNATGNVEKGSDYTIRAGDFESYVPPSDPMFNDLLLYSRRSDFILKQIDIAIKSDNLAWAEYLCRHILQYDPDDIEATEKYILVMLVKHTYEGLDKYVDRCYDFYFNNDEKLTAMAETFHLRNQHPFAFKYLKRALLVNPQAIKAHILYLKILVHKRLDDIAIKHCEKVLAQNADNFELRSEYGRVLALQGKEKEAKKQLLLALNLKSDNEEALILLGIISQTKGDINAALKYYRQSVKANPLNVKTVLKLGNYLLELKRWNEALKLFQKSLSDSPNDIDLLERYAWIQATCPDPRIRNGEKALELARRISLIRKTTAVQNIQCGITLAAAYAETKDFSSANRVLNNLIARAKKTRLENHVPRMEQMINLFISKKPYRL